MPGMIVVTTFGLLMQQAVPYSPGPETYRPPAIRPFEPSADLGQIAAQGDGAAAAHRSELRVAVVVDAYARSYEFTQTEVEEAYDQGVSAAETRTNQTAGPFDGLWVIRDSAGQRLFAVLLSDTGASAVEGGWRKGGRRGAAIIDGDVLILDGAGSIRLQRTPSGWRGVFSGRDVTISRPD